MRPVALPPYAPDVTSLMTGVSSLIQNVVPRVDGYGPMQSLQRFSKIGPGVCRGYFFARRADGSILVFFATSTDLYLVNNTDLSWIKVSKGGAAYNAVPNDANWQFVQFNDTILATQQNTVVQAFTLGSSTEFADLAGSPPQAGSIAIVGFFVVLTDLLSNTRRVQWSDLGNITVWTAGVGLSDFQD